MTMMVVVVTGEAREGDSTRTAMMVGLCYLEAFVCSLLYRSPGGERSQRVVLCVADRKSVV